MNLDYIFPYIILKEELAENTLSSIKKQVESKFSNINELLNGNEWEDNIHSTFKNCKCIITKLNLTLVEDIINPLVDSFYKTLNLKQTTSPVLVSSWINISQPNGFQDLHIHGHNYISGVLYLDAPENSGNIQFQPPLAENSFKNVKNYTPKNGQILIFHGQTPHRVLYNKTNMNRISLSFNYKYDMV